MLFEENLIYHIYNQGNNRERLFYSFENLNYFKWKMQAHLLPFGDLIAYCLMDNHYHFLFWVKRAEIPRLELRQHMDKTELARRKQKYGIKAQRILDNSNRVAKPESLISLNDSIGILQKSYTQALNKQEGRSGSLFRKPYHSKNGFTDNYLELSNYEFQKYHFGHGNGYVYTCLNYIHNNPVKAKIVLRPEDYLWSSSREYADDSIDSICNRAVGRRIMDNM